LRLMLTIRANVQESNVSESTCYTSNEASIRRPKFTAHSPGNRKVVSIVRGSKPKLSCQLKGKQMNFWILVKGNIEVQCQFQEFQGLFMLQVAVTYILAKNICYFVVEKRRCYNRPS